MALHSHKILPEGWECAGWVYKDTGELFHINQTISRYGHVVPGPNFQILCSQCVQIKDIIE
jgi:hypothetical protein